MFHAYHRHDSYPVIWLCKEARSHPSIRMKEQRHIQLFTEIYEAESDAIFRFCLVKVSDREQALDLTQETFTRLWQTLTKGTSMTNTRAFLFTIAHHLVIDWYRKKKAVSLDEEQGADGETVEPADETTLVINLESGAEGRYLIGKINEINPSYREAVYLRYVEGLSPPDIGKILHISANAASVRINRGLEELRKLTGYDAED